MDTSEGDFLFFARKINYQRLNAIMYGNNLRSLGIRKTVVQGTLNWVYYPLVPSGAETWDFALERAQECFRNNWVFVPSVYLFNVKILKGNGQTSGFCDPILWEFIKERIFYLNYSTKFSSCSVTQSNPKAGYSHRICRIGKRFERLKW